MGLIRYLILGALLYLAGMIIRRLLRGLLAPSGNPELSETDVTTVRCHYCGLFIPKSEACLAGEQYFCSEEHKRIANSGS